MKKSRFLLQLVIVLAMVVLLSLYFQRSLIFVMEYIALVILLFFQLIPVIFIFGVGLSLSHFRVAFAENPESRDKERAIGFFKFMTTYTLFASIAVSLAMTCFLLGNLRNPETFGPFLAVILITPLYGLLLSMTVYLPLRVSLENNL